MTHEQAETDGEPRPASEAQAARASLPAEGRLAGVVFAVGGIGALPGSLLIQPAPPARLYVFIGIALVVGIACLFAPWERMNRAWLHAVGVLGAIEITAVAEIERSYVFLYVFLAIYAAYVVHNRLELGGHLAVISLCLLAPLIYDPGSTRETLKIAVLAIPALVIPAGMVLYLRERLEADRRAYRGFAQEALEITAQIRGVDPEPVDERLGSESSTLMTPHLPPLPSWLKRRRGR